MNPKFNNKTWINITVLKNREKTELKKIEEKLPSLLELLTKSRSKTFFL